jgi:bacillithiol biosynthesis cysteine-adding enzyme BshC
LNFLQHITLQTSGIGGNLTQDYVTGKPELKQFYSFNPDFQGLATAISERMNYPVNRQLLYDELHHQYGRSIHSEQLKNNIELLLQPNTFTITTGHQLNLFTGPLYFIYKIASVISLAKQLNEEMPGKHFIPVYWMNSEDHDFAEINHFFLNREKFEWKVEADKYGPVGRMPLDGIELLMEEIRGKFKEHYKHDPVFESIIRTYIDAKDLVEAHRTIVNKIFGEYGLVIIDQDSAALKTAFIKQISKEIFERSSIQHVAETNSKLEQFNYKLQVFARDINYFYTGKGYRERIIEFENGFALADHSMRWTQKELEEELKKNPQFFSPNVVTRPMFQEFILPNIAYIGGPAEIAYWLQYKTNFHAHHIFYPALILRDCFLIIPEKKLRKVNELGLKLEDFFHDLNDLLNEFIKKHYYEEMNVSSIESSLKDQYAELLKKVAQINPSMQEMVEAAQTKALKDLNRIVSKMNKSLKDKNELQINYIKNLHAIIFPLNIFQERLNNLFDQTQSTSTFIKDIILHANPLDARLKVLVE